MRGAYRIARGHSEAESCNRKRPPKEEKKTSETRAVLQSGHVERHILQGKEPPLILRRESQYLYFGPLFPCTPGPFPVVRDFLCIIPTEQVLYYRNLGLYYGLASGILPLYSRPCLEVKGGCVSCEYIFPHSAYLGCLHL